MSGDEGSVLEELASLLPGVDDDPATSSSTTTSEPTALTPPAGDEEPRPIFWWATGKANEIEASMEYTAVFVEWLIAVYDLDRNIIPACWTSHPDLVQELWALAMAHRAAHTSDDGWAPIQWAGYLDTTRRRLKERDGTKTCMREHKAPLGDAYQDARRATYPHRIPDWTWPTTTTKETS